MKIYTRSGDTGETSYFLGSERVKKNDIRIEVFGTIDELNSSIGVALSFTKENDLRIILEKIQHDLFTLSAEIAARTANVQIPTPKLTPNLVKELEDYIDEIEPTLNIPRSFVLPGGTQSSALLHLARTIARRAERLLVTLDEAITLEPEIIRYINRLSDLLYILARKANKELVKEQQPIYKYIQTTNKN